MNTKTRTNVLATIVTLTSLTVLSQYTAGRVDNSSELILDSGVSSSKLVEEQFDALSSAVDIINESHVQTFNNTNIGRYSVVTNIQTNQDLLMQSLRDRGFDDFHVKTLETINNGNEASHLAIWSVTRESTNGERELVIGKISTHLGKREDGDWETIESTWTQSPF